jgi:hypothetical protein
MWLRSSCGYDADAIDSHGVGHKEHSVVDHSDRVEAQFTDPVAVVKLDRMGIKKYLRGRPEVDAVLLAVRLLLGAIPLEIYGRAS